MWKIATYSDSGSQETTKNHQIRHQRYAWGQRRSVTPDGLLKVKRQCQRSDVFMFWPKPCIMSPFQSMVASPVDENTISLKNRSEAVPPMTLQLGNLDWPGHILSRDAHRMLHKLCKISAWSAQQLGGHFRIKPYGGGLTPPPPLHGRGLKLSTRSFLEFRRYHASDAVTSFMVQILVTFFVESILRMTP